MLLEFLFGKASSLLLRKCGHHGARWCSDHWLRSSTHAVTAWERMQDATSPPEKKFDRTNNLASAQIISYRVTEDQKWCTLVGIAPGTPEKCVLCRMHSAWSLHIGFRTSPVPS